jgi:ABC-type bacteriocin/lantibiotic exporter with double-glycine peptidase domain
MRTLQLLFITLGSIIFTAFLIFSIWYQDETLLFIGCATYLFYFIIFFMITSNMGEKKFESKKI